MKELLFLAQRCPYPPNKGDKIVSWNLLKFLTERYRVHLGTFIDDPYDWQYAQVLRDRCASVYLAPLHPGYCKVKALSGLMTGDALSVAFYRHAGMQAWVDRQLEGGVPLVFVFSSAMARFVTRARDRVRIMDFADIDSDKWRQYAAVARWPMSWVYRRESVRLLEWERRIAAEFDHSLFVTEAEAVDFRSMAPESAHKVSELSIGVDAVYFAPDSDRPNPHPPGRRTIVFTGAMDYRPNVDAVVWFAREVLPLIRQECPEAGFCIVGVRPAAEVQALAGMDGITVTGRVEDVRPYLEYADLVVAPMRIARGIQSKVIEAMAMAKTVVCTPQAYEGITADVGKELLVAEGPGAFAAACLRVMDGLDLGAAARARVLADFDWGARLAKLGTLLEPGGLGGLGVEGPD